MTRRWGKLDTKLHENDKFRNLPATAAGIWLLTVSWSADNETDGFVPRDVVAEFCRRNADGRTTRHAGYLVKAGLWDEVDGGYMIHDFADYQLTKVQKVEVRAADATRQARSRATRQPPRNQRAATTLPPRNQHAATSEPLFPDESVVSRRDISAKSKRKSERRETSSLVPLARGSASILDNWWRACDPKPDGSMFGHVRKVIETLLAEHDDWDGINAAVAEWHKDGIGGPGYIPTVYFHLKNAQNRPAELSTTDQRVRNTLGPVAARMRELDEQDAAMRGITAP